MRKIKLISSIMLTLIACTNAMAQVEIPTPAGRWTFDNTSDLLAVDAGSSMSITPCTVTSTGVVTNQASAATANITTASGPVTSNKAVTIPKYSVLKVNRASGATATRNYTIMMDVKTADATPYIALVQTNQNNNDDGDLFIYTNKIGIGGVYDGTITNDTWHRIVMLGRDGQMYVYVDGSLVRSRAMGTAWEIGDWGFYLFCDNDDEMRDVEVAEVAYWETGLSNAQVAWLSYHKISNANDLKEFADFVNSGYVHANAYLTADIDYTAYPKGFIGIDSNRYSGTFDGQEHTVTTNIKNDTQGSGLFGSIYNATIKNLVVDGNVESSQKWLGGLGGISRGNSTIQNVIVKSAIKYTGTGDSTCGGIFGDMENAFTITNCAFVGSINVGSGTNVAGLVSWTGGGSFNNCLVAPVSITSGDTNEFSFKWGGGATSNNCYLVSPTDARLATGELCYMLNGSIPGGSDWYQNLSGDDVDAYPVPFSTHDRVYLFEGSYVNLFDFAIGNATDLINFATLVNAGGTALNGVLTADIDLNGVAWTPIGNGTYQYAGTFDGAGHTITNFSYTATDDYNGLFGYINGATVKDFSISGTLTSTYAENGVIGWTNGAAVVSGIHSSLNITVDCATHTGGVVGGSQALNESTLLVENCTYDGTLTSNNNADAQGGIIGYTYAGTIRNCLFNGTINGNVADKHYGGILGYGRIEWFGGIHNCLSIGKIATASPANAAAIIGNWNGPETSKVTNNYYLLAAGSTTDIAIGNKFESILEAPVLATAENLASGEICYKLNGNSVYEPNWFQNLSGTTDANPVLFDTHGIVNNISDARYTTQYIPTTDVTIPASVEVFAGIKNGDKLTLVPIKDAVSKEDAVIVRGNAGYYSFVPTTGASNAASNDLKGSDGTIEGNGSTIYALAKKNDVVGFYPVAASVTIPAGKAYLEYTGNTEVKGFTFVFDDNSTGLNDFKDSKDYKDLIYNIAGQRLNKMQKGINIVNGKKILR